VTQCLGSVGETKAQHIWLQRQGYTIPNGLRVLRL